MCAFLSRVLPLGTQPATQACAPTGNPSSDPLVHRPGLNALSHTSQGINFKSSLYCCSSPRAAVSELTLPLHGSGTHIFFLLGHSEYMASWRMAPPLYLPVVPSADCPTLLGRPVGTLGVVRYMICPSPAVTALSCTFTPAGLVRYYAGQDSMPEDQALPKAPGALGAGKANWYLEYMLIPVRKKLLALPGWRGPSVANGIPSSRWYP